MSANRLAALAFLSAAACAIGTTQVIAQSSTTHQGHAGHSAPAVPKAVADLPSVKAYQAANDKMHKDMSIAFSGDADDDFVRGMIPHHQGAVDMAKVVLEHGKDPAIRRLARSVIRAQNTEIAMMKAWLKKHENKSTSAAKPVPNPSPAKHQH